MKSKNTFIKVEKKKQVARALLLLLQLFASFLAAFFFKRFLQRFKKKTLWAFFLLIEKSFQPTTKKNPNLFFF